MSGLSIGGAYVLFSRCSQSDHNEETEMASIFRFSNIDRPVSGIRINACQVNVIRINGR